MTKSRSPIPWLLPLTALGTPAAAQAPATDPAALIAAQRAELRGALRPGCTAPGRADEIVVCAPRDDGRFRVPPSPVLPGSTRTERAGNAQLSAMEINDADECSPVGRAQSCGYVDFLGMGVMIVTRLAQAIEERGD